MRLTIRFIYFVSKYSPHNFIQSTALSTGEVRSAQQRKRIRVLQCMHTIVQATLHYFYITKLLLKIVVEVAK